MKSKESSPREKLNHTDIRQLHDTELIALVIRSGTNQENALMLSNRIYEMNQGDLDQLSKKSMREFSQIRGIGTAKAAGLVAAFELGKRSLSATPLKAIIKSSEDAYHQLSQKLSSLNHEEFWILMLNRANKLIGMNQISKGGIHGTIVDPKVVFKTALEYRACGLILAHNHPSGNTEPSRQDKELTKKIIEGASLIDISVFDHIIVGDQSYFSFADNNLI